MHIWQFKISRVGGIVRMVVAAISMSVPAVSQLSFDFQSDVCHHAGGSLVLEAEYTGAKVVDSVDWYFDKQTIGNNVVVVTSCTIFGAPDSGYPNDRMSYSCDTVTNTYKATISDLKPEDEGEWGVVITFGDFTTVTTDNKNFSLCPTTCTVQYVENGEVNTTQTTVNEGTSVVIVCREGFTINGTDLLECQSDETWDFPWPLCEPKCCCCCCCICCFIVLIVCVALGIVFSGGHIGLTWTNHEHSVKKILFIENNETEKTNEAVYLKDYAMKVVVPECCICVLVIIIQIAVYFAALKWDCNEDCDVCEDCDDDCCGVVVCLVVTIIVSIVKNAIESGIIFFVVRVKGQNYTDQAGHSAATKKRKVMIPNDTTNDTAQSANL